MTQQWYIHQQADWPALHWRQDALIDLLAGVRYQQGRLCGRMEDLGFAVRQEAAQAALTDEVVKSSEIEGEILDPAQVRAAVARRLGLPVGGLKRPARNVEGVVALTLDATLNYADPLTAERLCSWHKGLFPAGRSNLRRITAGNWRDDAGGPMQVVTAGVVGKAGKVYFEAPPAAALEREMRNFLDWFNAPPETDPALKAGLAHWWFITIHPFDDGNGRIARAITDMLLARSDGSSQRYYSMSSQIMLEREAYYRVLENTQKGTTDITRWLEWFLACLGRAITDAQANLDEILIRARFWAGLSGITVNPRQRDCINRLRDGFEGKLTRSKWARIGKCSLEEAQRDIAYLIDYGILAADYASGREPGYQLAEAKGDELDGANRLAVSGLKPRNGRPKGRRP